MTTVRFTEAQRLRLAELVLPEQVNRLESILPLCQALWRSPATMTDVRDKLTDVAKALRLAHRRASGDATASKEVRARLELAAGEAELRDIEERENRQDEQSGPLSSLELPAFLRNLAAYADYADSALRSLPVVQRHTDTATHLPIERIDRALIQGFIDHHRKPPFPDYMLKASVTQAPFPEIVEIVYAAIGNAKFPERAIKAYIALKKSPRTPTDAGITADGPFSLIKTK